MDTEKIRNLTDTELRHQERELNDQLFRLKFQLRMGQTESLKKLRGLRKDVARVKTVMREKQLTVAGAGGNNGGGKTAAANAPPENKIPRQKREKEKGGTATTTQRKRQRGTKK